MQNKRKQLEEEQLEMERQAKLLVEQVELKAKERQLSLMKKKIQELMEARQKAQTSCLVLNPEFLEKDETAKQMATVLDMLQKEDKERKRLEEEEAKKLEQQRLAELEQEKREQEKREQQEKEKQEQLEREKRRKGDRKKLTNNTMKQYPMSQTQK